MNAPLVSTLAVVLAACSAAASAAPWLKAENEYLRSSECAQRTQLARQIAGDLAQGYSLDAVNIVPPTAPESAEQEASQQAWAAELKAEIAEAAKPLDPQEAGFADRLAERVAQSCISKRDFHQAHFVRTASSYALANPDTPMRWKCDQRKSAAMMVVSLAKNGLPQAAFWEQHPIPEHWSDGIRSEVMALVDAAYAWPGGTVEFCDRVYKDCMQAR
jgi:hypothetical protein